MHPGHPQAKHRSPARVAPIRVGGFRFIENIQVKTQSAILSGPGQLSRRRTIALHHPEPTLSSSTCLIQSLAMHST